MFTLGSDDGYGGSPESGTFTIDGSRGRRKCPYGKVKSGPRKGQCRKRAKSRVSGGTGRVVATWTRKGGKRCRNKTTGAFKKCR